MSFYDTTSSGFLALVLFGILSFYYFSRSSTSLIKYIARTEKYDEQKISVFLRCFCIGMAVATLPCVYARKLGHPWLRWVTVVLYFAILVAAILYEKKGALRQIETQTETGIAAETETAPKKGLSKIFSELTVLYLSMVIIALWIIWIERGSFLFFILLPLYLNFRRWD